ncbi:MAG: Ku protein [Streptosporangiales bacterium]|nr:Ku protein [Streptosporangiales bacterium]
MRSIWKGAISFGLVTIPVKLYSATEQRDVSFNQVHREDAGRIRYRRMCTVCGNEVPYSDIAKGYELPSGEVVVLTDEDFADLPLSTSRAIEVLEFVPLEHVDPIFFARSYYLEPDTTGLKPYVLLREALEESGKIAIVKLALRQRESLATLRVRDGVFVLETMLWPDEIREADFEFLQEDVDVRPQELKMAGSLIDSMSGEFQPDQYHDAYREALEQVIEAKVEGREVVQPEGVAEEEGAVVDLMAALRASVEAAKKGRGEAVESPESDQTEGAGETGEGPSGKPAAKRKTPARKASTRKTSARKTAAGEGSERSSSERRKARESA